jgi:hypothetical protein
MFSLPSLGDGNSFRNAEFSSYSEIRPIGKVRTPVILNVIQHLQNPLEFNQVSCIIYHQDDYELEAIN